MNNNLPTSGAAAPSGELVDLAERLGVTCVLPDDHSYESDRRVYNRMHNLYPDAIIQTRSATAVAQLIQLANKRHICLAVRGGGHHIAGFGTRQGGVVLDFSPFRRVRYDPESRIVEVEPGAQLRDIDAALCAQGRVLPTGTVSSTGLAGLALGGGVGWLLGSMGLTCDHLVGADVVLGTGELLRADDVESPDLMWGLRGGGGGLGVVTRFRFATQALPTCTVGSATIGISQASASLGRLVEYLEQDCPRALTVAPVLADDERGEPSLFVDFCLTGTDNDDSLLKLAAAVGPATWEIETSASFEHWQRRQDSRFSEPKRGYWKATYLAALSQEIIDSLVESAIRRPGMQWQITLEHLHGAFHDPASLPSAFPSRWAHFGILASARWHAPDQDEVGTAWVRRALQQADRDDVGETYLNYASSDDVRPGVTLGRVAGGRLQELKRRFDPLGLLDRNHLAATTKREEIGDPHAR